MDEASGPAGGGRRPAERRRVCLAVSLCAAFLAALAAAAPEDRQETSLLRIRVSGGPRQRGVAHGRELAARIRHLFKVAVAYSDGDRRSLREAARGFGRHIRPRHREEMKGVAEGAGLAYEDVLALNCWYEIEKRRVACRQIVVLGSATAEGALIHGRNLDWADYGGTLSGNVVLLECEPENGGRLALLVWPGMIGSLTGTNEHGLTIAANQLGLRTRTGEPVGLLLRRVLEEAGDLTGALEVIQSAPITAEVAIVVSDAAADRAACVEWYRGRAAVRRPEEGILAVDNAPHAVGHGSARRRRPPWTPLSARAGAITPGAVRDGLGAPLVMLPWNLYSCVFVPAERRLWVAAGTVPAARRCRFRELTLFGEPSPHMSRALPPGRPHSSSQSSTSPRLPRAAQTAVSAAP